MVAQGTRIRSLGYAVSILLIFINVMFPGLGLSASNTWKTENLEGTNGNHRGLSIQKGDDNSLTSFLETRNTRKGGKLNNAIAFLVEKIEAPSIHKPSSQIAEAQKIIRTKAGDSSPRDSFVLTDLYFDTHRNRISDDAAVVIEEGMRLLNRNDNLSVKIEAHCDERGARTYNMALGNKRVQAIQEYLEDLGVSDSRITALSYGHEKPLCTERTQSCWEDNLRIQSAFRLLAITQSRNGCMVRLKFMGKPTNLRSATQFAQRQPFLQRIRVGRTRF